MRRSAAAQIDALLRAVPVEEVRALLAWVANALNKTHLLLVTEPPRVELQRFVLHHMTDAQARQLAAWLTNRCAAGRPSSPDEPRTLVLLKREIARRRAKEDEK